MSGAHLMRPEWLWLALPALAFGYALWRSQVRRGNWRSVISSDLLPYLVGENAGEKRRNLAPLLLLGWLLACIAAAGPSFMKIPQPVHQKQDAMVLLYDLSYSMKSQDLAPSRADRARQKLKDLLAQRREGQTGLIAFAGDAHIVTPLTDDIPTINNLLPSLHPDMMPVPGSDAAGAVALGLSLLRSAGIRGGRILLVTDGVSDEAADEIGRQLRGSGVSLTVMGVGTAEGAPIPLPGGGFLKDDNGTIVMPQLEENSLRELAVSTGGRYTPMRIDDRDLQQLLATPMLTSAEQTLALDRTADTWEDQGYLLMLLLLPLVLALFRRGWVLGLVVPLLLLQAPDSYAQDWSELWATPDQQGQRALQEGDPQAAAELFENQEWAGTAAYEGGDYEAAAKHFGTVPDADGWYNRGNALANAGRLDDALAAYDESLQLDPEREDALANKALVEQLKEQEEQQQQEQEQQEQQQQEQEQQEQQQQEQQQDQEGERGEQDEQQGGQKSGSGASNEAQAERQPGEQDNARNPRGQPRDEQGNSAEQRNETHDESEAQDTTETGQAPAAGTEGEEDNNGEESLARAEASPEEQERNQAMEQWLRRVPDDPSGLLREKFRYESRQRREEGRERQNEQVW